MPLYIRCSGPAGPVEVLAHRVAWSVVVVALLLAGVRRWSYLRRCSAGPDVAWLALAAALLAVNWGAYIYAVDAERVVEMALGYFITPLVSVLLGVTVLRERLRPWQWVAVAIGSVAVAVLTVDYGRLPYVALTLAAQLRRIQAREEAGRRAGCRGHARRVGGARAAGAGVPVLARR